ncbi:hypothetical protein HY450_01385 [Candidatus Pacearchaeota archaeon]|nr:hypothetical protein [Candidatus Pacearchaeota archaeon]
MVVVIASLPKFTTNAVYYVEKDAHTCSDPDGNLKFDDTLYVSSTVERVLTDARNRKLTYEDECYSTKKVLEFYCDPEGYVKSANRRCPAECVAGACVRP